MPVNDQLTKAMLFAIYNIGLPCVRIHPISIIKRVASTLRAFSMEIKDGS